MYIISMHGTRTYINLYCRQNQCQEINKEFEIVTKSTYTIMYMKKTYVHVMNYWFLWSLVVIVILSHSLPCWNQRRRRAACSKPVIERPTCALRRAGFVAARRLFCCWRFRVWMQMRERPEAASPVESAYVTRHEFNIVSSGEFEFKRVLVINFKVESVFAQTALELLK